MADGWWCVRPVVLVVWLKETVAPLLIWWTAEVTVAVSVTVLPALGRCRADDVRLVTELAT